MSCSCNTFFPHSAIHIRFLLPMFSHDFEFKEFHQYISPIIKNVRGTVRCLLAHLDLHSVRVHHVLKVRITRKVEGYLSCLVCFTKSL